MSHELKDNKAVEPTKATAQVRDFLSNMTKIRREAAESVGRPPRTVYSESYLAHRISTAPLPGEGEDPPAETPLLKDARLGLYRLLVWIANTTPHQPTGESIELDDVASWKTWIGSVAHLIFLDHVSEASVRAGVKEVSGEIASRLGVFKRALSDVARRAGQGVLRRVEDGEAEQLLLFAETLAEALLLPPPGKLLGERILLLAEIASPLEVASYYAIVVFLCGRPVSEKTTSVMEKRPKNLEDKFNRKQQWNELTGPLKMSVGASKQIGQAWELDPAFRQGYFHPLISLTTAKTGTVASVVTTMVSMLAYGQMSHIKVIHDFLKTYPFVSTMPSLSREMYTIQNDSEVMLGYPAKDRLFMKVLLRDQLKVFDSRSLSRLIKLAVDVMGETEDSIKEYEIKGAEAELRDDFDRMNEAERKKMGLPTGVQTIDEQRREVVWAEEEEESGDETSKSFGLD